MNGEGWGCGFNFQNLLGVCNLGIKTKTIPDIISANHKLRQCYIISTYSLSNTFTFISWMINNYFFLKSSILQVSLHFGHKKNMGSVEGVECQIAEVIYKLCSYKRL